MVDRHYAVEVIAHGKTKGTRKTFNTLSEAHKYGKQQYSRGKAVAIDRVNQYSSGYTSQRTVLQKGLQQTGLGKGKKSHLKKYYKDFGKFRTSNSAPQRTQNNSPFGTFRTTGNGWQNDPFRF